jgi:ribosomal protein S18 acetylase RimI-like enzyme
VGTWNAIAFSVCFENRNQLAKTCTKLLFIICSFLFFGKECGSGIVMDTQNGPCLHIISHIVYPYESVSRKSVTSSIMHFIRQAQPTDQGAIIACVHAAYAKYIARMGKKPAPSLANYALLIAQEVVYVLANEEGIQGVLVMMPQERSMFVENVAIDPRFQGQGLGRVLMTFVEQQARRYRLDEIRLYTNELMTENLHFYRQLGFEEEERRIEDGYHRIFLRKTLV